MATEQPATFAELRGLVAEARRVSPLTVPEGTATKLAAAGVTMAQARTRLFRMIIGDSGTASADEGLLVANMRRQVAKAGLSGANDDQPRASGSTDARSSMAIVMHQLGVDPKGAA